MAGTDEDGPWAVLKDERTITLHLASAGVGLNVTKIRKVRNEGDLVYAENVNGDSFVVRSADIFAGSLDPGSKESRKAGFR